MTNDLAKRLDEARAEVERLERLAGGATCREMGRHDWKSIGGCNAGCDELCSCSVPVHQCKRCGDCDYGENAWAEQTRADCLALQDGEGR